MIALVAIATLALVGACYSLSSEHSYIARHRNVCSGAKSMMVPSHPQRDVARLLLKASPSSNLDESMSLASEHLPTLDWRRKELFGQSLVQETIHSMEIDSEFQHTKRRYDAQGATAVSKEERAQRRRALTSLGIPSFATFVHNKMKERSAVANPNSQVAENPIALSRKTPAILQLNVGLYCNQACSHCHVESSPLRTEAMSAEIAARCLLILTNSPTITTLDITGGAPELNSQFRYLVSMARKLRPDVEIIDRCNLTVLQEPGQEDLITFLQANKVRIVASLPCYTSENVDKQRGRGVFERSIASLLALNEAGYAVEGTGLRLDLVYNPGGPFLPGPQKQLENDYKAQLSANFGVSFDSLFTITNMPIKRFADALQRKNELRNYMELLVQNFNLDTLSSVMCLDTLSVGYDGRLYDCDFNQQLGFGIRTSKIHSETSLTIFDIESCDDLRLYSIRTDNHCYGCTAGSGSSCQGTIVN
jgi:radical SAM/Cys-rich protein